MAANLKGIRKSVNVNFTMKSIEKERDEYKNILTDYHQTFKNPVKYELCNVVKTEKKVTLLTNRIERELKGNTFKCSNASIFLISSDNSELALTKDISTEQNIHIISISYLYFNFLEKNNNYD